MESYVLFNFALNHHHHHHHHQERALAPLKECTEPKGECPEKNANNRRWAVGTNERGRGRDVEQKKGK
jgi:hypothetical protein